MSATLKALLEQRATAFTEIRKLADLANKENREFTPEEKAKWEKVNADYDALTRRCDIAKRAADLEKEQGDPADPERRELPGRDNSDPESRGRRGQVTEEQRALALQAWFRHQMGEEVTERQVEACRAVGLRPEARELRIPLLSTQDFRSLQRARAAAHPSIQERALSAVTLASGGAMVPETLLRSLEVNMLAFGGVLQVAEVIRTRSGEAMSWPTANDTGNTGRQLGESQAIVATSDPSFGRVVWNAYKFTSDEILVPTELLEDSVFDIASAVGAMLGERLGRILATKFATGSGAGTPKGLVTASSVATLASGSAFTASATAIAADEVLELVHSVNPAYRQGAAFLMHDNVLLHLRKLKNGDGSYLWQSGLADGAPDRLAGYPVNVCMEMASSVAASAKTILFGQLNRYKVRQVNEVRMYRLVERHRENDQDAFLAFVRSDGNLLEAGTPPVRHLLQHA